MVFDVKMSSNKLSLCRCFALEASKSFNQESKIVVDEEEKCGKLMENRWQKAALHPSFMVGGRSGVVPVATTWSNFPHVA